MSKASCLLVLLGVLFVMVGCPEGGNGVDCADAEPCGGDHVVEYSSDLEAIMKCSSATSIQIHDTTDLANVEMPCLESVSNFIEIAYNEALISVDLPNLESVSEGNGGLFISSNPVLNEVDIPKLGSIDGCLAVTGNDCWSESEVESFAAAIDDTGVCDGSSYVGDNGDNYPRD